MVFELKGGTKLEARLKGIAKQVSNGELVSVGFLENATYPDGSQVANIAAINEFGGSHEVEEHKQSIFRKVAASGDYFLRGGKFVKRSESNFESIHTVPAHTVTTPPRPFFRTTIAKKKGQWGTDLAEAMKATDCDAQRALNMVGAAIKSDLQQAIVEFSTPPNAPSTIAKKGFNDPLIDSGHMLNSVDWEVK